MRATLNIGHCSLAILTPPAPQACSSTPSPCALGIQISAGGLSASTSPPLGLPPDYHNLPSARKHNTGLSQASIKSSFSEHVLSDPALTVHLKPLTVNLLTSHARPANVHALCWYPQATPFMSGPPSARGTSPPPDAGRHAQSLRSDADFRRNSADGNTVLASWLQGATVATRPFLRLCAAQVTACEASSAPDGTHEFQGLAPPVDITADIRKGLTIEVIVQSSNAPQSSNSAAHTTHTPPVSARDRAAAVDHSAARSAAPHAHSADIDASAAAHASCDSDAPTSVACVSTGAVALLADASCLQNAKNVLDLLNRVAHRPEHDPSSAPFGSPGVAAANPSSHGPSSHPAHARMHAMRAGARKTSRPAASVPMQDSMTPVATPHASESRFSITMHTQHVVLGVMAPVHAANASQGDASLEGVAVVAHAYAHASVECSPEEITGSMHVPELRVSVCNSGASSDVLQGRVPLCLRPLGDTFGAFGMQATFSNVQNASNIATQGESGKIATNAYEENAATACMAEASQTDTVPATVVVEGGVSSVIVPQRPESAAATSTSIDAAHTATTKRTACNVVQSVSESSQTCAHCGQLLEARDKCSCREVNDAARGICATRCGMLQEHVSLAVAIGALRVSTGAEDLSSLAHILKSSCTANWHEPDIVSTAAPQNAAEDSASWKIPQVATCGDAGSSTLVDTIIDRLLVATSAAPLQGGLSLECNVAEAEWTIVQRHSVGDTTEGTSAPTFSMDSSFLPNSRAAVDMHAPHALSGYVISPIARVRVQKLPSEPSLHAEITRTGGTAHAACTIDLELLNAKCQAWDSVIAPWPLRATATLHPETLHTSPSSSNPDPSTALIMCPLQHTPSSHAAQNLRLASESSPSTRMHAVDASGSHEIPGAEYWEVSMHVTGEQLLDVIVSDATAHAVHALAGLVDYAGSLASAVAQGGHIQTPPAHGSLHLVATGVQLPALPAITSSCVGCLY